MSCPSGGECDVRPFRAGWGRCSKCGDESFPVTAEAAGALPCCGQFGEHARGCDGVARQPWALARNAEAELDAAIRMVDFPPFNRRHLRERLALARQQVRALRWEGRPPEVDDGPGGGLGGE